jgi:phosphohistidine swiveling domain-containing protein
MRIKWQPIFTAKTPTLFQWYIFEGEKKEFFKEALDLNVAYTSGKNVSDEIFYDLNELIGMEKRFSSEIESDPSFINKYIKICYRKSDDLISISRGLGKTKDLNKLKAKGLLPLYKRYQKAVFEMMPFMTTPMVIDNILRKKILDIFESKSGIKNKINQDLLLSKLIIPKKKNYFVKEEDNLLRMALKLQKNKKVDIGQDIKKHLEKYAWTSTNVYLGRLQTKKDVMKKLKKLLKENPKEVLAKVKKEKEKTLRDYNKALTLTKKSKDLVNLINLAREFLFLQTHKMEVLFLAHFYVLPLLKEIGRRFEITVDELIYLTGEEIVGLLEGTINLDIKEIKNRMKAVAVIKERNKFTLLSGDKVKRVARKATRATMVKGTVASKGKAKGKAKLLYEVEDMQKIQKGDIIVSPMTRPHFVPALKRASGIVTDFGGILCHAALISREFGIPCVVGTKYATKVFKDNDLVELDAYKGIVRKIT